MGAPELVDVPSDLGTLVIWERPLPEGMAAGETDDAIVVTEVCVGQTRYPLRKNGGELGRFQTKRDRVYFLVERFSPLLVGEGRTEEEAVQHWCELIHVRAQRLRATLAISRTPEERAQWELLCGLLDLDAVEASPPVKLRQRGQLISAFPNPWKVEWEDGHIDTISLEAVPADFVTFKEGDWLVARVDRHPRTWHLLSIYEAHPAEPPQSLTPEQAKEYWESLPTQADLPLSDRDWTKP